MDPDLGPAPLWLRRQRASLPCTLSSDFSTSHLPPRQGPRIQRLDAQRIRMGQAADRLLVGPGTYQWVRRRLHPLCPPSLSPWLSLSREGLGFSVSSGVVPSGPLRDLEHHCPSRTILPQCSKDGECSLGRVWEAPDLGSWGLPVWLLRGWL